MNINNLSKEQRAYLAGLIDGEGQIGIITGTVVLKITQAEKGKHVLDMAKEWIGAGTVGLHTKAFENHQAVYRYRLQSTTLNHQLFLQIAPYLVIKKDVFEKTLKQKGL